MISLIQAKKVTKQQWKRAQARYLFKKKCVKKFSIATNTFVAMTKIWPRNETKKVLRLNRSATAWIIATGEVKSSRKINNAKKSK